MDPQQASQKQQLETAALEASPAARRWAIGTLRELMADLQADRLLQEALGEAYRPMNPRDWRPSEPPPGWTWAEYEAELAAES